MLVFDAPDLFLKDFTKSPHGEITSVISSSNWWVTSGCGAATRLYSGLQLAYLPSAGDGQPLVRGTGDGPGEGIGLAWFSRRNTSLGRVWESYSLAGPLHAAITRRSEQEPDWSVTRGYYWLCGPGLGGCVETLADFTLIKEEEAERFESVPVTFAGIKDWLLARRRVYGVLWRGQDGRVARVLRQDMIDFTRRKIR